MPIRLTSTMRCMCRGPPIDSITVSVFADIFIELTNTETAATTLWERLQNLWRASAQGKVLESGVFWWISYPTHMKSMLSGFLGSQVHHRRAERGVSITLPSLRQSNFGKLQFGFVLADFQISPTLKLYFWALFRPALHKMSQIKWCHVKINNPEKNISLLLWKVLTLFSEKILPCSLFCLHRYTCLNMG